MTPNFVNDMNITLKEVNTFNRELSISLEWSEIEKGLETAIINLLQFRLDEGKKLEDDITQRINKL